MVHGEVSEQTKWILHMNIWMDGGMEEGREGKRESRG
jgi:hypothetical protein